MGQVAAAVQDKICCKQQENSIIYSSANIDLELILIDQQCFNQQQWYVKEDNKLLFYPEKFIFLYTGYKQDHDEISKHWDKLDLRQSIRHGVFQRENKYEVLAQKWQYLIRKGVPMKHMRTIILDTYKCTFTENQAEYSIALNKVFVDNIPSQIKNAPLFIENNLPIEEVVKFSLLTKQGFEALKRILYVIKEMYKIEYNPMIVQITSLLLVFLKEEEAFSVLKLMIEDSIKLLNEQNQSTSNEEEKTLRWHFFMKKDDFMKQNLCQNLKMIFKYFNIKDPQNHLFSLLNKEVQNFHRSYPTSKALGLIILIFSKKLCIIYSQDMSTLELFSRFLLFF